MALYHKIAGVIGSQMFLGIGSAASLMKWTASLVSFRNKADSAYVDVALKGLQVYDPAGTNKTTVGFANGAGADRTFNLPPTAGSAGQVLQTDGSGGLSWASTGTTAACVTEDTTSLAFGTASPLTLFTLPAGAVVRDVRVVVDTAFNGTAPTMSVGIAGTTSKYTGTGDVDLKTAGEYVVSPGLVADGGTNALIATYAADSSSAGAARILVAYSVPQ